MRFLIQYILTFVYKVFGIFFKTIGLFVPLNSRMILLGSMNGQYYGDSSAHLFEWILENRRDLFPVWVTRNKQIKKKLNEKKFPVVHLYSLKLLWYLWRTRNIGFTNSLKDVVPSEYMVSSNCKVIYLTHDIAPKRSRYARVGHPIDPIQEKRFKLERKLVTDYISTSPFISRCRAEALKVSEENFHITGLPRNDILIRRKNDRSKHYLIYKDQSKPEKVILYAPTWRSGREPIQLFPFEDMDKQSLINLLKEHNALLLIRCHKNDLKYKEVREKISWLCEGEKHINDGTHGKYGDINLVLPEVDILLTDYSGILHDFLLLDRPCLLIPYDIEKFEMASGFFYDFRKMAPGPLIYNFQQFTKKLNAALSGKEEEAKLRQSLLKIIHTFADDKACERVVKLIENKFSLISSQKVNNEY